MSLIPGYLTTIPAEHQLLVSHFTRNVGCCLAIALTIPMANYLYDDKEQL